jgi:hypothetical protein
MNFLAQKSTDSFDVNYVMMLVKYRQPLQCCSFNIWPSVNLDTILGTYNGKQNVLGSHRLIWMELKIWVDKA